MARNEELEDQVVDFTERLAAVEAGTAPSLMQANRELQLALARAIKERDDTLALLADANEALAAGDNAAAEAAEATEKQKTTSRPQAVVTAGEIDRAAEQAAQTEATKKLTAELASAQADLAAANIEVTALQQELAAARADLLAASDGSMVPQQELATARADLLAASDEVTALQQELAATRADLLAASDEVTALQQELADSLQQVLDAREGEAEGGDTGALEALEAELAQAQVEGAETAGMVAALERQVATLTVDLESARKQQRDTALEVGGRTDGRASGLACVWMGCWWASDRVAAWGINEC